MGRFSPFPSRRRPTDGSGHPPTAWASRTVEASSNIPIPMPKGDKGSYSTKQKRKAAHIEKSYEKKGVSKKTAKSRAWATVNKSSGGGKKSGSGRGKKENKSPSKKGGRKGRKATARRKKSS